LILFVNPDKESLVVVVEDTSARWPVSVETASLEETVTLLEKEMISDELFLVLLGHAFEWVEFSGEVTFETLTSLDDETHDFLSLLLGNAWSEREGLKVATNTDSSGHDHASLIFWERWSLKR
jgi:hypothetical protein